MDYSSIDLIGVPRDFMITLFILGIVTIGIILYAEKILISKSNKSSIRNIFIGAFSFLIAWVISHFLYLYFEPINFQISVIFLELACLLMIITTFMLSNVTSYIFTSSIGIKRSMVYTFIFSTTLTQNINLFVNHSVLSDSEIDFIINTIRALILLTIVVMVISVYKDFKNKGRSLLRELKFESELKAYRAVTLFLIVVIPITIVSINLNQDVALIYYLVIDVFFIAMIFSFRRTSQINFFQLHHYFQVLIINSKGNLIFQKNYAEKSDSNLFPVFSSWLYAFTSIIAEFLKEDIKPEMIELEGGLKLRFVWKKEFFIAVVVDQTSPLIVPSMEDAAEKISQQIDCAQFNSGIIPTTVKYILDEILTKNFFYVNFI